jgi:gamma-glutamyl phosphate reductase
MLKTLAILLSLGTAYSTATYAMNPDQDDFSTVLQRVRVEQAGRKEALQQMKEKLDAEDRKLRDATYRDMDALINLSNVEEMDRMALEFKELQKNVRAAKEAAVEEFNKQFGDM